MKKKTKIKSVIRIIAIVVIIIITIIIAINFATKDYKKYNKALGLIDNGQYEEAIAILSTIEDYKDSKEKILQIQNQITEESNKNKYEEAMNALENGEFEKAIFGFKEIEDYSNSLDMEKEAITNYKIYQYDLKYFYDNLSDYRLVESDEELKEIFVGELIEKKYIYNTNR